MDNTTLKYLFTCVMAFVVGFIILNSTPFLEFAQCPWEVDVVQRGSCKSYAELRSTGKLTQLPDFSKAEVFCKIPKILHQTWKTADKLPQYRKTWLEMHPNWTHHLWTDEENRELVRIHYPWLLAVYDAFPVGVMRSDTSHYLQMHRYGGMYADLDMEPLRPLDFLIEKAEQPVTLGYMRDLFRDIANIQPGFLISQPGHPLWLVTAMDILAAATREPVSARPDFITGPVLFYDAILLYEKMFGEKGIQQSIQRGSAVVHDLRILRPGLIYPYHWSEPALSTKGRLCGGQSPFQNETECKKMFPDAYTVQYSGYSWGKEWENFLQRNNLPESNG